MTYHRNVTFEKEHFVIEECIFYSCKFIDCDFSYSGGEFHLANCETINCRFHWFGMARLCFEFFRYAGIIPSEEVITPKERIN